MATETYIINIISLRSFFLQSPTWNQTPLHHTTRGIATSKPAFTQLGKLIRGLQIWGQLTENAPAITVQKGVD